MLAAFDVPVPWLDRVGVTLLSAALVALTVAVPARPRRWLQPWQQPAPPAIPDVYFPPTEQDDSGDEAEMLDPMPERP